jgi:hypothetical protein
VAIRKFPLTMGEVDFRLYANAKVQRDKINLDLFWLKDKSLEDSDDLPEPLCTGSGDRRRAVSVGAENQPVMGA